MEYNLEKWLEPSFYSPDNNFISPYPSSDFVNPGIGSVVSLFTSYQSTHQRSENYSIQKEPVASLTQEGSGETQNEESSEYVKRIT